MHFMKNNFEILFMVVCNGVCINVQHNSARSFVVEAKSQKLDS